MAIFNLGSINIDHVYRLDHLPKAGETLHAVSYAQGLGGKGANQSIAAARAGASVRHLGAMSAQDEWVIGRMAHAGVDVAGVQRLADVPTGHAIILVEAGGENSIIVHGGANQAIEVAALTAALQVIDKADTLLLQNETSLQLEAARMAVSRGARVIYSAAPFDLAALRAIMPHVSIIAMNEEEARQAFAAFGEALPVKGLLITRGRNGAEFRDLESGQIFHQAAFPVVPVDTTGAGDCFAGSFSAALDSGQDIPAALRYAAAAAALQVTRFGAGDAMPNRAEVLRFLQSA